MATNNSTNTSNPITVSQGGTGDASFTSYAVLCGGTTATSAIQSIASVGTTNMVLTSNGAAALPTFKTPTSFSQIVIQKFTSSGTYTPTTGMKYCISEVWGGGGGGGGSSASTAGTFGPSGGGAGGNYSRQVLSAASVGVSQTVTVGSGGSSGSSGNGGAGGTSSIGSLVSANGGNGGLGSPTGPGVVASLGGTPGSLVGGISLEIVGQEGQTGLGSQAAMYATSGYGGAAPMQNIINGNIAVGGGFATTAGRSGIANSGSGGAGGLNSGGAGSADGGVGGSGLVIITEYI